jgi:hypothetical protein
MWLKSDNVNWTELTEKKGRMAGFREMNVRIQEDAGDYKLLQMDEASKYLC